MKLDKIPSVKIMQHTTKARRIPSDIVNMERTRDLGPLSYTPKNPNLKRTDNLKKNSIGNSLRQDFIPKMKIPAPNNYNIKGDFEKAAE